MKVCPKCRSFYADESLEFCLNDGILLSGVNANEKIWEKGQKFLRNNNKLNKRRKRIYSIKKVFVYTVTTVIFTAVVIVALINTIVYLTPNEVEIAKSNSPKPSSDVPTTSSPTPTPDSASNSATPTLTPTPTPTPTPTRTRTPTTCNKQIEISSIRTDNLSLWTNNVEKQRAKIQNDYARLKRKYGQIDIKKGLNEEITIGKNCLTARVKVNYEIYAEIPELKSPIAPDSVIVPITGFTNYNCTKDEKWHCSIIETY